MKNNKSLIIFLNQVSGRLFRELAEGLADAVGLCILYTGSDKYSKNGDASNLKVIQAPNYQQSNSYYQRLLDWIKYFCFVFHQVLSKSRTSLLFIVSNPPFLPLIGYLMKKIRRQSYVVLVYDIYPDIAINLGKISKQGILACVWRLFNKVVWKNSEVVFTIGDNMAMKLEGMFEVDHTRLGRIAVIPNWVDGEFIKPLRKRENWFAQKYGQVDKLTVLYSGNLGATHDLETILRAGKELDSYDDIQFLVIGDGYQRTYLEKFIDREQLSNIILLPFQPEEILPYSLTTGDVAVITVSKGVEGLLVPSKVYYAMASGAALLCVSSGNNELKDIIKEFKCGISVEAGDAKMLIDAIEKFYQESTFLKNCKNNARKAAETYFTKKNIEEYRKILVEDLKLFS